MARTDNKKQALGGYSHVIATLRAMEPHWRNKVLHTLTEKAPHLVKIYENCSLIYSDLVFLDDHSIQKLLMVIEEQRWLLAFKLTSPLLQKRLVDNMSVERKQAFLSSFQTQPKVPRRQVLAIQIQIARIALNLLEKGQLKFRSHSQHHQKKKLHPTG